MASEAKAYLDRGDDYYKKGQYDLAIADYNKAIVIDPKLALAYYGRGNAYGQKGQYDQAWEDLKKAQKLGYQIAPKVLENLRKASGRQD